jgi:hypothetical protein
MHDTASPIFATRFVETPNRIMSELKQVPERSRHMAWHGTFGMLTGANGIHTHKLPLLSRNFFAMMNT